MSYMIAKEKLAFTKMKPICELEESHSVNLGVGYKNNHACAMFVSFIAKEQKNCLLNFLSNNFFFLFFLVFKQMPVLVLKIWSSELFLINYFDAFAKDGVVHIRTNVFTARHLDSGTGESLFVSLKEQLNKYMNVEDWRTKIIGLVVKSFPDYVTSA